MRPSTSCARAAHGGSSRASSRLGARSTAGSPLGATRASRRPFPFVERVFADAAYVGDRVSTATSIAVEIVRKRPDQIGFTVHAGRWIVECLFAWIGRNQRLAKDFEATIASATAFLYAASVVLLTRMLAKP